MALGASWLFGELAAGFLRPLDAPVQLLEQRPGALADRLANHGDVWTTSRSALAGNPRHVAWSAADGDLPDGFLPASLHGLAYCPGTIRLAPFDRLADADFEQDFTINLLGAVRAIRSALPALRQSGAGSIVLFSTVAAASGMPLHASVAAAKGAVEGLARSLAAELAPQVRVNVIAPSLTNTPLAARLLKTDRQREAAAARHPLARVGEASEVAELARYLMTSDSSWITGQVIGIDGGLGSVLRFG